MRQVLIFSLTYYPHYIGGAEVAVKEITDRIPNDRMHFDLITLGDGRGVNFEKIGNVSVYRVLNRVGIFQKILFPFYAFKKAQELNKNKKYDIVWSIMASYAGFAGFLFKQKNPAAYFLLTVQEGDHFARRTLLKPFFKKIFASADQIQAISNFLAEWSKSMGAKCPIDLIPNAVDIELFSKKISSEESLALKNKLGKKENDIFLITTSRLVAKNAVGDIIDALSFLPDNIKLLILGNGPEESKLKKRASRLENNQVGKNQSRVQFLGYIPHSEMPKFLQISEIFIRPSLSEGLGNSFLEAMAAGIPVIGTAVGGIPDFLKDGETGLFCEINNPRSIAQKVEKLIKDKESREYIVKRAEEMVKKSYQWQMIAEKIFPEGRLSDDN